ncbi:MAG: carboxypeptidase-like regulatory domain-containing protein [Bacteroidales bacterium]|nr:carboxypeptidase-like regulatory domain-containing protein [Bacteroidales bacterium]
MKKLLFILLLHFLFVEISYAQSIKGYVKNTDDETLTGAVISIENTYRTTISDSKGIFEFKNLKPGNYVLITKFIGYETKRTKINFQE